MISQVKLLWSCTKEEHYYRIELKVIDRFMNQSIFKSTYCIDIAEWAYTENKKARLSNVIEYLIDKWVEW